jgi:APA family basic amino acid/polyamine antiporter
MDWLFFGLSASCLFVFRRREKLAASEAMESADTHADSPPPGYRVPGHPWTTGIFVVAAGLIVLNTIFKFPRDSAVAVCILLVGVPVYFLFRAQGRSTKHTE